MPSARQIERKEQYELTKADRALKPKIDRKWEIIKQIPPHVESEDVKMALRYLLEKTDYVEMMQFPKDQSQYRAHLDDGVYKGEFVFTWTENGLTPLRVYEKLQQTGWPGYSMGWVKDAAREEMKRELSK